MRAISEDWLSAWFQVGRVLPATPFTYPQPRDNHLVIVNIMNPESLGGINSQEKSEKQQRWDEIARRIERTVDSLGMHIDEGIKDNIIALNALDIHTTASCEGHAERTSAHAPWVDVESNETETLTNEAQELIKDKDRNREKIKEITQEIEHMNLEERKKLFGHLDAFYQGRTTHFVRRLVVQNMGWGRSRLQSQGADLQKVEPEEIMMQRLVEYQEEMAAFATFLRENFFRT
jgi:uncharacterized FlaG/YvyC family protein